MYKFLNYDFYNKIITMIELKDFKEDIHKCSKCGLCQKDCPIYKVTGNDCSVSRGQFIMLKRFLNGDLKMTKNINRYLSLCLKCGKCSESCPSGVDAVDILCAAKYEYYKTRFFERTVSVLQKRILFGIFPDLINIFIPKKKSKKFDKKVLYFGGCNSKYTGNSSVIKIMNTIGTEVITPNFSCCGMPFLADGNFDDFRAHMNNYISILKKYEIKDIVTTCASCEKTIRDYIKWCDNEDDKTFLKKLNIKNIYEYLHENNFTLKLKKHLSATFHKPCNEKHFQDVDYVLNSTENLKYIRAKDYDKCCGLHGFFNPSEYKTLSKIFKLKRDSILSTKAEYILTTCFGCKTALNFYSFGKYKTSDLIEFLANNI